MSCAGGGSGGFGGGGSGRIGSDEVASLPSDAMELIRDNFPELFHNLG